MPSVTELRDKRNQVWGGAKAILDKAAEENRPLTAEERTEYEKREKDMEAFEDTINKFEKAKMFETALSESAGRAVRNDPVIETDEQRSLENDHRVVHKNGEYRHMNTSDDEQVAPFVRENRSTLHHYKTNALFPHRQSGTVSYEEEYHRYLLGAGQGNEMRALQADSDVGGGFTVPTQQFANQLIQAVHDQVFVLGLATNYTVTRAESLGAPALNTQMSNAQWGTELSVNVGGADASLNFGKRELRPHPMVNEILVSKKLIRTSAIDVEALVRDQLAYHFAVPLEQAFLQGSGANQPLGVFTASNDGISTGRDFISAASSAIITSTGADDLFEVKFALKGNYWPRAAWIVNRLHFKQIRQLKDANSQYLWSPGGFGVGVSNGQPDRLTDFPIYMSEYAPTSTASGSSGKTKAQDGSTGSLSGYVAICGDFSKYWTATALDMTIQVLTELKAETNQNAYLGRMEVDGMPVIAEAFSRYKLKGY